MRHRVNAFANAVVIEQSLLTSIFPQTSPHETKSKKLTMINYLRQSTATELSSLKFSAVDRFETMSSGFDQFDDEIDSNVVPAHQAFDRVAELGFEEVQSTDDIHSKDNKLKPKRPLSAYNWFFASERQKILQETPIRKEGKPRRSHGKIGFADLARMIAAKWKGLSKEERSIYDQKATADKDRYIREMDEWKKIQSITLSQMATQNVDSFRNSLSLMNEPIDPSTFADQAVSFFQNSATSQPPDNPLSNEMKMASTDYFFNESYSLANAFGAHLTRRMQEGAVTGPPVTSSTTTEQSQSSPPNRQTLDILASQLGDESTELFLNIFRES